MARLTYSRDERLRKAAAEGLLTDSTAAPADKATALKELRWLESAAKKRQAAKERESAPPAVPTEPTVEELVSVLEAKPALHSTDSRSLEPILAPPADSPALEVTPTEPVAERPVDPKLAEVIALAEGRLPLPAVPVPPPEPTCPACGAVGLWNTFWPVDSKCGPFCPTCFGKLCAADMLKASAKAKAAAEAPADWAAYFNGVRNVYSDDYQKSVEIWQQQDIEKADRQEQDRADRAAAAERLNRQRAEYISRHGMLAPHDTF